MSKSLQVSFLLILVLLAAVAIYVAPPSAINLGRLTPATEPAFPICKAGVAAPFFAPTRQEIQRRVLAGLREGDEALLLSLAACDFLVGPPESDSGGFNAPARVVGPIITALKGMSWPEEGHDYKSQYNLPAADSRETYELIFRNDEEEGKPAWYWGGLATTNESLLSALYSGSYEIGGEEPKEPAPKKQHQQKKKNN